MTRLVLDVTTAEHAAGGIGTVARGLLGALPAMDSVAEITIVAGPTMPLPEGLVTRRVRLAGSGVGRIVYQRVLFPAAMQWERVRRGPIDRVLHIDACLPLWSLHGGPEHTTVFVHDVLPLTHPQFFAERKDVFKRLAFRSIRRSRPSLVTSCEYTAAEILRVLGLPARVARFGCGQFSDSEAQVLLLEPIRERANFVLYVGAVEPRKDLQTLMRAVDLAGERDPALRLALVGDWSTPAGLEIRRWAVAAGIAKTRFLGRVNTPDLREMLLRARALVYPSAAEGFGLPVLEALAASTPVIATDLPAIRSWAADCVSYFHPGDAAVLAEQLAAVDSSHPQVALGRELSEQYRWANFAMEFLGTN